MNATDDIQIYKFSIDKILKNNKRLSKKIELGKSLVTTLEEKVRELERKLNSNLKSKELNTRASKKNNG